MMVAGYLFSGGLITLGLVVVVMSMPAHRRQLGLQPQVSWAHRGKRLGWLCVVAGLLWALFTGNSVTVLTTIMWLSVGVLLIALCLSRIVSQQE